MFKNLLIFTLLFIVYVDLANAKIRGTSKVDGLHSTVLNEHRDLLIQLPNSYYQNTALSYPVLYLTDGLRNFNHASGTLDLLNQSDMAHEMIIVAIKNTHRTRDFTPTYVESYNQWGISGGADKFLDFIEQELKPYIDKHYRTNNFNILSGHSLGGLLTIYSLQTRPHLFQAHFAFSPSLWWHEGLVLKSAEDFFANTDKLDNYLYINMADETGHMRTFFDQYKTILAQHSIEGFSYNTDLVLDENHGTSAMVGQNKAYVHLFNKFKCPKNITKKGLPAIEQYYKELSKIYRAEIKPSYPTLAQVAGSAFNNKNYVDAIDIYQKIILKFPHLSDPYYRIAYIYHAQGEYRKALDAIDKAITASFVENVENNKYKQFQAYLLVEMNKHN